MEVITGGLLVLLGVFSAKVFLTVTVGDPSWVSGVTGLLDAGGASDSGFALVVGSAVFGSAVFGMPALDAAAIGSAGLAFVSGRDTRTELLGLGAVGFSCSLITVLKEF